MNQDPETFSACVNALPAELQARAEAMSDYAANRPRQCLTCQQVREAVWLAMYAAYVVEQQHTAGAHEPPSCIVAAREAAERAANKPPPIPVEDRLVVATDGSCKRYHSGMGYVTSDGRRAPPTTRSAAITPTAPTA